MLSYYGYEPNREGKYLCPFHNEDTPSLSVTDDDKHFECFGCHKEGNIVDLVREMEAQLGQPKNDYKEIYNFIIQLQNLPIEFTLNSTMTKEERENKVLYDIMKEAQSVSEWRLNKAKENNEYAYRYLTENRKLGDSTIKEFGLGYNHKSLVQDTLSKKYKIEDMATAGVIYEDNGNYYDSQSYRLLIPIADSQGRIVAFGGRSLSNDGKYPKYKNTRVSPIFQKKNILFNYNKAKPFVRQENEVLVVEGYFDAISAWELGFKNTVAVMGSEITEDQAELLKSLNASVTLCLDNDEVGRSSICKNIPVLYEKEINVNVIDSSALKAGKDMNDFLVKGISKEDISKVKVGGFTFLFDYYFSKITDKSLTAEALKTIYNDIFSDDRINDSYVNALFEDYVVQRYDFSRDSVHNICNPQHSNPLLDNAMKLYFGSYILRNLKAFASKTGDKTLQQFLEQGRFDFNYIIDGFTDGKFLSENGRKIDIKGYCEEYLVNTDNYLKFAKSYDTSFDRLFENIYAYNKSGESIKVKLNAHQKDLVIAQFYDSFNEGEINSFKEENDRFLKLYIADNLEECKLCYGSDYAGNAANDFNFNLQRFTNGKMVRVDYFNKYNNPANKTRKELVSAIKRNPAERIEYLDDKNMDFQISLVFNNIGNILKMTAENYIKEDYSIPEGNVSHDYSPEMMEGVYSRRGGMFNEKKHQRPSDE